MPFSDRFKKEDKQQALIYSKEFNDSLELAKEFHRKGDFDKSEMHLAHALRLNGDLRIMNIQHQNHEKMMSDHAYQTRRNWF